MAPDVLKIITEKISKISGIAEDSITPDSKFQDLGIDSLDTLAMISDMEDELKIMIPNQELLKLTTVGQIVECIQKRLS